MTNRLLRALAPAVALGVAGAALLLAGLPAVAPAAPAAPDSTRYYIEENGAGTGWFAVGRTTNDQGRFVYRGSGEKPDTYKIRHFVIEVGPDFAPVSAFVKMSAQGQTVEYGSTFDKGQAVTWQKTPNGRMNLPEEKIDGTTFVLPGQVTGAFAIVSDWLAKQDPATFKAKVKAYTPPFMAELEIVGQGRHTVQAGQASVEVRAFQLTLKIPASRMMPQGRTQQIVLWQQADGRFFGFEIPDRQLKAYPFPSDAKIVEAPKPFPEVTVRFAAGADTLVGSLMLPAADPARTTKPAAVVFVSGSGPSSRDEFAFGFPVFRTLAQKLAAAGYASLRYDDRGVGDSGGSYDKAAMTDFAQDAVAAIAALRARPEVDPARVGLLGHSEGAMLAPEIAALTAKASGQAPWCVVLMAGSAMVGRDLIMEQFEHGLTLGQVPPEVAAKKRALQVQTLDWVLGKVAWETVAALADSEDAQSLELQKSTLEGAWFRTFLTYDPKPWLQQLKVPVLILHGELDTQLPPAHGAAVRDLLRAAGNPYVSYVPARGVNHLFQLAKTGEVAEYGTLKKEFAPGIAERVTAFLAQRERIK